MIELSEVKKTFVQVRTGEHKWVYAIFSEDYT